MEITELLASVWKNNASDLHLSPDNPPILRSNGDIKPLSAGRTLSADEIRQMLYEIMTEDQRSDYEKELETDFSVSLGDNVRFRVNAFNAIGGSAAVFRTIPTKILSLDDLAAPPILKNLAALHKGLVLVTGPTGSGKSTTLAAMVNHVNENFARHIITIEDPIEFVHKSKKSLVNQREVGTNTKSFARALKSCLREDPDVILVGELRDVETIQLAMTAAETGHLVMGTLHTNSAPKTIDRIIDVFPANDKPMIRMMLSSSIEAVITQSLIKKADGTGRVAAHEIMVGIPAIRNCIREGKIAQLFSSIQTGSKFGMISMKESLLCLANENIITADEMRAYLTDGSDSGNKENSKTNNRPSSF